MTTVISATNRPDSRTQLVAKSVYESVSTMTPEAQWLDMKDIPLEYFAVNKYHSDQLDPALKKIHEDMIIAAQKFVIIAPEYNGSFPGFFKFFIDAISVHRYKEAFSGKSVALMGVASGRAGNLRGLEHLTGICQHVGMHVWPDKRPIGVINEYIDKDLLSTDLKLMITEWIKPFIQA